MPSLPVLSILLLAIISSNALCHVGVISVSCRQRTLLSLGNNRWWDGDNSDEYDQYETSNKKQKQSSLITREMEEEVMASARSTVDFNTVSRAVSSLIDGNGDSNSNRSGERGDQLNKDTRTDNKSRNSLRDLASMGKINEANQLAGSSNNSWDAQQIAIASGAATFFLSPLVVPIIHSCLPALIPFPNSVSVTGAALLGTVSYIVALGDPTDKSNIISGSAGSVLGDGVEVGGAVSRIVGRTALQSVQTSAPRLKAAARAMVDYDDATTTLEDLQRVQRHLSQTVMELETENDILRKTVALWQAVEDMSSMYKLEELKEMAKYEGLKGYSSDGKNALLRRLVKEGILKLDLGPYC